jgi:hypothetical protein
MHKETYTETRQFHYPKGTTPHLKHMYMHKSEEPVIKQQFSHQPDPVDFDYVGDLPQPQKTLEEIEHENKVLYALKVNKMMRQMQ